MKDKKQQAFGMKQMLLPIILKTNREARQSIQGSEEYKLLIAYNSTLANRLARIDYYLNLEQ